MASFMNGNGNGAHAGPSNGHLSVYSSPPTSPHPVEHPHAQYAITHTTAHYHAVISHLFQAGFRMGNYSDITLHVPWRQYPLHAIILSRSPYLAHMMSTSPSSKTIVIPLEQEQHITAESFDIALGYLYSPVTIEAVNPHNARAVLAAACFLGGMDDLCNFAYQMCQQSITEDTVFEWLDFIESIPTSSEDATPTEVPSVFGPYGKSLREDVYNFVAISLPTKLGAFVSPDLHPTSQAGQDRLLLIYSRLPFEFFKRALESPQFPLHGNHARFKFAKKAIEMRKQRGISRDTEETVVLAFDGQTNSEMVVHITRKTKKRALWKVNAK